MYDNQSKYEMNLRQGKVDIAQGVGNALKCAIEFVSKFPSGSLAGANKIEETAEDVIKWTEFFFQSSQRLIKEEYETWRAIEDEGLKTQFGIKDIEEAKGDTKVIDSETPIKNNLPKPKPDPFSEAVKQLAEKHNKPEIKKWAEEQNQPINQDEL